MCSLGVQPSSFTLLVLACISLQVHLPSYYSLSCVANMPRGSVIAALACLGGLDTGALTQLSDISPGELEEVQHIR